MREIPGSGPVETGGNGVRGRPFHRFASKRPAKARTNGPG
jgi:hypothetical protein